MRLLTLFFLCICFALPSIAQPPSGAGPRGDMKGTIKGIILDAETDTLRWNMQRSPLYAMRDSSLVTGGVTNEKGEFLIEIRPGRFFGTAEYISYEPLPIGPSQCRPGKHGSGPGSHQSFHKALPFLARWR